MSDNFLIGSHVSMSGPKYFLGSVLEAINDGANTLMFYTGSPQCNKRTDISKFKIEEGKELMKQNGIDINNIVCHAPYLINIATPLNAEKHDYAENFLLSELNRCHAFGAKLLVLHPGCHIGQGKEVGIQNIIFSLNKILGNIDFDITICLETMAGKGSECGSSLEEIKEIINGVRYKDRIGVCIDTCHLNDAGYDLTNSTSFLEMFDKIIGLKYLKVCHLNDSMNQINSHKDRHANIGFGTIGFKTLYEFAHNPIIKGVPKILETPYINGKSPYKLEIKMLKENYFDNNLIEKL